MLPGPPCFWEMWAELGPNSSSRVWGAQSPLTSSHFSIPTPDPEEMQSWPRFCDTDGWHKRGSFHAPVPSAISLVSLTSSVWLWPSSLSAAPYSGPVCLDSLLLLWGLTSQARESTPTLAILGFREVKLVMLHQLKVKKSAECLKWRCSLLLVGEWPMFIIILLKFWLQIWHSVVHIWKDCLYLCLDGDSPSTWS